MAIFQRYEDPFFFEELSLGIGREHDKNIKVMFSRYPCSTGRGAHKDGIDINISALPIELIRPIILSESVFNLCLSFSEGFIDESVKALIVFISLIGL